MKFTKKIISIILLFIIYTSLVIFLTLYIHDIYLISCKKTIVPIQTLPPFFSEIASGETHSVYNEQSQYSPDYHNNISEVDGIICKDLYQSHLCHFRNITIAESALLIQYTSNQGELEEFLYCVFVRSYKMEMYKIITQIKHLRLKIYKIYTKSFFDQVFQKLGGFFYNNLKNYDPELLNIYILYGNISERKKSLRIASIELRLKKYAQKLSDNMVESTNLPELISPPFKYGNLRRTVSEPALERASDENIDARIEIINELNAFILLVWEINFDASLVIKENFIELINKLIGIFETDSFDSNFDNFGVLTHIEVIHCVIDIYSGLVCSVEKLQKLLDTLCNPKNNLSLTMLKSLIDISYLMSKFPYDEQSGEINFLRLKFESIIWNVEKFYLMKLSDEYSCLNSEDLTFFFINYQENFIFN